MEAGGPHSSPGLCDTGNVCPQGVGPGQGAEEVQVRGVEEAHGAISAAAEDVVLAHRDAVGHGGLQAEGLSSAWATRSSPPQQSPAKRRRQPRQGPRGKQPSCSGPSPSAVI